MRLGWIAPLLLLLPTASFAGERYEFDKEHTNILFFVNHLGFSDMVGEFKDYDGHFNFNEQEPEKSSVEVTLRPQGIDTDVKKLDEHLQAKDFFNSAQFPTITFKSTKVEKTGDKQGRITGDLTLLGVTKPVTLDVTLNKVGNSPIGDRYVAGFTATGTLKRSDFGMTAYVPNVGDEVRIHIETEGVNTEKKIESTKNQPPKE